MSRLVQTARRQAVRAGLERSGRLYLVRWSSNGPKKSDEDDAWSRFANKRDEARKGAAEKLQGFKKTFDSSSESIKGAGEKIKEKTSDHANRVSSSVGGFTSKVSSFFKPVSEKIQENPVVGSVKEGVKSATQYTSGVRITMDDIRHVVTPEAMKKRKAYSRRQKMAQQAPVEEEEEYEKSAGILVRVGREKTRWDHIKESIAASTVGQTWEKMSSKFRETSMYDASTKVKDKVNDRLDDVYETYETSQHPLIWRAREIGDSISMQTDHSLAVEELVRLDPEFSEEGLVDELEHYMGPIVIQAYRRGEMSVLEEAMDRTALASTKALVESIKAADQHYDDRILDISHIELMDILLVDGETPVVTALIICQHINCAKNSKGEVVSGSENDIQTVQYVWQMTRNTSSLDFNWKIVEMSVQGIAALI